MESVTPAVRETLHGSGAETVGFSGGIGHITDLENSLVYMRARYYDPSIGRFISEDPGRNGTNWHIYCGNNPVNAVDPSGKIMGEDELAAEVEAAGVSIGLGQTILQRIEIAMYAWGAQILGAMEGKSVTVDTNSSGTGIYITDGASTVFIDVLGHLPNPHFDVQAAGAGWDAMWRALYASINKLQF